MGTAKIKLLSTAIREMEKGKFYELWYMPDINSSIVDFLERMKKKDLDEYDKLLSTLRKFLEIEAPNTGIMKNPQRFEKTKQFREIFEMKNGGRLRVTCFFKNRRLILVRGFEKGRKKVQNREFKTADDIRKQIVGEEDEK